MAGPTRAARITGPRAIAVADARLRQPADGEVVLRVAACGICGSNLHEWRHPERGITPAGVPSVGASGHEVVGEVLAPRGHPRAGARVVVEPQMAQSCGTCPACRRGTAWFCPDRHPLEVWGLAERMVVPARATFRVPDALSDAAATLAEPMASAVHALRGTEPALTGGGRLDGVTVAVIGCGVAGLLAVTAARHLGAGRVVAVGRYPHQAEMAARCGAAAVLRSAAADLRDSLKRERPQLVVEAVGGTAETFDLAVRSAAAGGEIAVLGLFDSPQALDARRAVWRELRLTFPVAYGVRDGVHDFDIGLAALAEHAHLADALVSHRFALDEVARAFETAADKSSAALRVVVVP